ncbi:Stk1 family PASTA domain-containing Ser/Thr kinase [Boudabousia liubingyangii]|uniref:Stk1 family PASTA domain-containing Ser/Thr kinase n=1 Tax=Boudabousia liubingyangii TaxID=1921764 RepID=UPI000B32616E|nr:Stk1 family PASTA domain-containing Ser/Thr kinase [Boudabousia liubingyangii]
MNDEQEPQSPRSEDGATTPASTPVPVVSAALTDPLIGLVIDGRYRVDSLLARGGMATVYRAFDERLEREVAVKVLYPHLVDSGSFLARFQKEARSVARLIHPNIVTVFDQGELPGTAYIVMQLIDGPSVRELIDQDAPFTLKRALDLTEKVLIGLQAAHSQGIIHRDIKPENILLSPDGTPQIADFGLAQTISQTSGATSHTLLGTVAYVAPELITKGESDERSDLYALGIMLFEMLTGSVPFKGANAINIAYAHVSQSVPPISQIVDWMPTEVDEFLSSLTAQDPEERFESAQAALADLRLLLPELSNDLLHRRFTVPQASNQPEKDHAPTARLNVPSGTARLPFLEKSQKRLNSAPTAPADFPGPKASTDSTSAAALPDAGKSGHSDSLPRRKWPWLLFWIFLIAGVSSAGSWWYLEKGPGAYYPVPQLQGLTQEQADELLKENGLSVTAESDFSDSVPAGKVIDTLPVAGEKQYKNDPVLIRISKGVEMLTVPELIGETKEAALKKLAEARFQAGNITEEFSEDVPAGVVIATQPGANTTLKHDSSVDLKISKGRQPFAVPNLVGKTRDAIDTSENQPFKFSFSDQFSDTVPKGVVISQEPAAGTNKYRSDEVKVVISKGPELFPVPAVFGKSQKEATKMLQEAGFKVKIEKIFDGVFGTVRMTRPGKGTMLPKGATVTLVVI